MKNNIFNKLRQTIMKNNNFNKKIDMNFLLAFNELPETKVYVDYLIRKIADAKSASYYYKKYGTDRYSSVYSLCLGLMNNNKHIINTIELVRNNQITDREINKNIIFLNEFYENILELTRKNNLTDAIEEMMYRYHNRRYSSDYIDYCKDIESIRRSLFLELNKNKNNSYIDFDEVDKKLASQNYFNEPSIKLFMEAIKERFDDKINYYGQVEGKDVYIDYDEVMEILDYVQNELQPKSEIQVKKRAKVRN